jgi:hypothetical protein
MNTVTREEYEALNDKLDMYIRCQNQREKDFNELERKVYQMEQRNTPERFESKYGQRLDGSTFSKGENTAGLACLT